MITLERNPDTMLFTLAAPFLGISVTTEMLTKNITVQRFAEQATDRMLDWYLPKIETLEEALASRGHKAVHRLFPGIWSTDGTVRKYFDVQLSFFDSDFYLHLTDTYPAYDIAARQILDGYSIQSINVFGKEPGVWQFAALREVPENIVLLVHDIRVPGKTSLAFLSAQVLEPGQIVSNIADSLWSYLVEQYGEQFHIHKDNA